jgi:peroxiredoxin
LLPRLIIANVLILKSRALQFFSAAAGVLVPALAIADLSVGQIYGLKFLDVDGNTFSTDDGHVTTVVLTTESEVDRARILGDRTPDYCLGNPTYRMITVVGFEKKHSKPVLMILTALVRRRLDTEAQQLQQRYDQLKIARNARLDVHTVADFDGEVAAQLGSSEDDTVFRVFVFGRNGALLKKWDDIPESQQLASVLK